MTYIIKSKGTLQVTADEPKKPVAHGSRLACMEFVEVMGDNTTTVRRSPLADFEHCDLFNRDKAQAIW